MNAGLIVTGFPRAGTTLLYCMLRHCVRGYGFDDREHWRSRPGCVVKSPRAVFHAPSADRCIVLLRDPRGILASRHPKYPGGYFVSAHSCLNDAARGLCEWWEAIRRLLRGPRLPLVFRYEALVAHPERVQASVIEAYGLTCIGKFRDFHRDRHGDYWESALGGVRPLAMSAAKNADRDRVCDQFAQFPELASISREMGYA